MANILINRCPFCNGKAIVEKHWSGQFYVICNSCYTESNTYGTEIEAILAWNRRDK